MSETLIRIRNLHKRFGALEVLKGIDIDVTSGERIAIIGSSGSGKSTLLRCINFMEVPTSGTIELDGVTLGSPRSGNAAEGERSYSERGLFSVRARVGGVLQHYHVSPHIRAVESDGEGLVGVKRKPAAGARERAR